MVPRAAAAPETQNGHPAPRAEPAGPVTENLPLPPTSFHETPKLYLSPTTLVKPKTTLCYETLSDAGCGKTGLDQEESGWYGASGENSWRGPGGGGRHPPPPPPPPAPGGGGRAR